ncbi:hypothetical protein N7532_011766 [Penicillium argentinense]|uniref:Ubiquitination network signaling protein acrB n=1 Tax=Penicillium argentinense TaxID=1131581 RepID=A0A9W9JV54_9EURO|nr:uncharacterized protein N7532_011766 [Penicillium argentinense]KAJ5082723.1 hypothetical protein N7532_011766 [Penicillium argentinense]
MPRSSAAGRKNQSNRHDNGLVGPGKKVTKQKSSGQLNASPANRAAASSATVPIDLSANRSTSDSAITSPAVAAKETDGTKPDGNGHGMLNGNGRSVEMDCSQANGAAPHNGGLAGSVARNGASKRSGSNASINPLQLASTILKSCPMYDTIAILIFLLQLPPMVLTMVQFLFASLTFMPPSGGAAGSLSSNFDIFQGPAGTPSLGTMIAMDGFCLLFWGLFMWAWAQNFAIDLAHVQVAITLGGGGSGKNGGVNALCVGIVLLLHIVRSKGVQEYVVGHLASTKLVNPDILSQFSNLLPVEFRRSDSHSSPSWLRSLLAVHILAQAGTAMVRRVMAQNRSPTPQKGGKRGDTEASAGSQAQQDSAMESAASLSSSLHGPDGQIKDGKDRFTSAKKRRRQANQVRSRQPFWAALASTKVTVMREYEHSRASSKATRGLTMAEDDLQGFSLDDGLVLITDVDSSSIKFAAGDLVDDSVAPGSCEVNRLDGQMEPFYVCVNGALWATATIYKVKDSSKGQNTVQWRGEISGLAPNCAYTCSFVRCDTGEEICAMSVKTPAAADTEQAVSTVPTPPQPPYRPSSPTTTLKNSIINAEAKLNEKRARLKKTKNDHKLLISRIRRELDNFSHRLNSGTDENRQKQRSLQLERNIRQTEEATAALEVQLDNMENVPEEELKEWSANKAAFERELERFNSTKEEISQARIAVAQQLSSIEQDLNLAVQKRERLQGRRTRVNEQYERLISANAQGLNERERRAAEQFAREQDQAKMELNFQEQFNSISQAVQDFQLRTSQLWQQASAYEQCSWNPALSPPEGNLPGTNPLLENNLNVSTTSAPNGRALLGLAFPPAKSSPLQTSSSPVHATSSNPTSPVYDAFMPHFPTSPLGTGASYFVSDTNRDRSFSNRSARSSQYGSEYFDAQRMPPVHIDLSELLSDKQRTNSNENVFLQGGRPVPSPFQRAASRGSGADSGSGGSWSGSGSPRSNRD